MSNLSFENAIRENKLSNSQMNEVINAVYNNKKIYFGFGIKSKARMYGTHFLIYSYSNVLAYFLTLKYTLVREYMLVIFCNH